MNLLFLFCFGEIKMFLTYPMQLVLVHCNNNKINTCVDEQLLASFLAS